MPFFHVGFFPKVWCHLILFLFVDTEIVVFLGALACGIHGKA